MYFKPRNLSNTIIDDETLKNDKTNCVKYGPCGVGEKAIYLNSFYIDRCYYIPFSNITRIWKRVAMSKGGFTKRGIFATLPYLVVEYDNGKTKQCNFKDEAHVDALLHKIKETQPQIKTVSKEGEKQLAEYEARLAERNAMDPTPAEERMIKKLQKGIDYLNKKPELSDNLSYSAKRKRTYDHTDPSYRYTAMAITVLGIAAAVFGIYSLITHGSFGIYFTLFGFGAIFLFAGFSILPTAKNNKRYIYSMYDTSVSDMQKYLSGYGAEFPLPAEYAHPTVLLRMQRAIGKHKASNIDDALELVKTDLKALNSSVEVDQIEYDEVVAVKPLFTVNDYR